MKSFLMASFFLVSTFALADDLQPGRFLQAVKINSAKAETVGTGFPMTHVTATATFSNECFIPRQEELVAVVTYSKDFGKLAFTLAVDSDRACTEQYAPVTVTLNLGTHSRPNDGTFSRITVNGVVAKKAQN